MENTMTHFTNQAELELMSETELHIQLRETFNAMANFEKFSPEYARAAETLKEIRKAIRRKQPAPRL
jgi:hypothetical protein